MPIPWSTTTISTTPSLSRTVVPTPIRVPASEYATALSRRLRTTVTSRSWSPSTTAGSPPTSMVMSLAVAEVRARSTASPTSAPTSKEGFVPVDVRALVGEAVDGARTSATARDITIEVGGDPAVVLGDHDLLVTVVRNLLDNAVAYSEAGTRIGVGTTVRD